MPKKEWWRKYVKDRYCGQCGRKMIPRLVGAEKYHEGDPNDYVYPYTPYSRLTGKRQYVIEYLCPLRRGLFSFHDKFIDSEVFTEGEEESTEFSVPKIWEEDEAVKRYLKTK